MSEQFKDDGAFFGATASAPVASDGAATAAVGGGFTLNLTDDDLTDGRYPAIPVGTWLRVAVYEVEPGMVKSEKNYGKPKYKITIRNQDETAEWGKNRKFTVFANLFNGAFFTAYAVFKAAEVAPTKESLQKGAFFDAADMDQFPGELAKLVQEGGIFTESKKIPKGAYVMPSPKTLEGLEFYAKVTHYSVSGSFDKFSSEKAALDAGHARAFVSVDEFRSVAEHEAVAKAQGAPGIFKGDA
jgi:hypothetical protein